MDIRMYVMTHKTAEFPAIDGYHPLLVGAAANTQAEQFSLRDDTGDHISQKNKNFCELTGVYWIWKNVSADAVGVCHYRRFFTTARFSNSQKYFLNKTQMEALLEKHDAVVSDAYWFERSIAQSLYRAPSPEDMRELRKALEALYPAYLPEYDSFMAGRSTCLYNMCLMKKSLFDRYCRWLFEILFYIEKDYDISQRNAYEARLFGFLSERLLQIWIMHELPAERVKTLRVVNTQVGALRQAGQRLKNQLRRVKGSLRR